MDDHVKGKVVIVTGAASGFGRLVAEKVGARGARVVVADIDAEGADAVATRHQGRPEATRSIAAPT